MSVISVTQHRPTKMKKKKKKHILDRRKTKNVVPRSRPLKYPPRLTSTPSFLFRLISCLNFTLRRHALYGGFPSPKMHSGICHSTPMAHTITEIGTSYHHPSPSLPSRCGYRRLTYTYTNNPSFDCPTLHIPCAPLPPSCPLVLRNRIVTVDEQSPLTTTRKRGSECETRPHHTRDPQHKHNASASSEGVTSTIQPQNHIHVSLAASFAPARKSICGMMRHGAA